VVLSGPGERVLSLPEEDAKAVYRYVARGVLRSAVGKRGSRFPDGTRETYAWDCGSAEIVSGGGPLDRHLAVRFAVGNEEDIVVRVTYTRAHGETRLSATNGIPVVVPTWSPDNPIQLGLFLGPYRGMVFVPDDPRCIPVATDIDRREGEEVLYIFQYLGIRARGVRGVPGTWLRAGVETRPEPGSS